METGEQRSDRIDAVARNAQPRRRPAASAGRSWASSVGVRASMLANRRRDTRPERALRSELHRAGLRFRVDHLVRAGDLRTHPDITFGRGRVAVFVDGCFWHLCPTHGTMPATNVAYWKDKLERNVRRDRAVDAALANAGWLVIRVWEHEDPSEAAEAVIDAVVRRHTRSSTTRRSCPAR